MNSSVHHVLVACLVMAVAVRVSAHDDPNPSATPQDFVDAHNEYRGDDGCPPVQWNETVAEFARWWANQRVEDCAVLHSQGSGYGENLAIASWDLGAHDAVEMWHSEKSLYDKHKNKCNCADPTGCFHYTQVVWTGSTCIGCAKVKCTKGYTWITCNYYPPGNFQGQKPF